jgi:hypothetical protein
MLLKGLARITCQNARGERVTVTLLPPGPIRIFLRCRLAPSIFGSFDWNDFRDRDA